MHPNQVTRYEALAESRKKQRSADSTEERPSKRHTTLQEVHTIRSSSIISQSDLDDMILDHIVEDLQPFSMTERPTFKKIILRLTPNRNVICRKTVMSRLQQRAEAIKQRLTSLLQKASWVATTTDCWSAHHRAFIGVTVHWMDEETMTRKCGALACKRLKGLHTFDIIAAALEKVHATYHTQNKITKTTTDNGSNFCKAFNVFGAKEVEGTASQEAAKAERAAQSTIERDENTNEDNEHNEGEEEWQYHSVEDIVADADQGDVLQYSLPSHQRCACHKLNLIATHDAASAESDTAYEKIYGSTFAKC